MKLDIRRLERIEEAWRNRPLPPKCPAQAHHGPGHQSHTNCGVPGDEPHTVHGTLYGSYNQFGVWKDDPSQEDPKYPWIKASDAFDPDDEDEALMREYELEWAARAKRINRKRLQFIAHEYNKES